MTAVPSKIFILSVKFIIILLFVVTVFPVKGQVRTDYGKFKQTPVDLTEDDRNSIDSIVSAMNLEEKINMLHGNSIFTSPGIERFGVKELTYDDGPHGVREEVQRYSFKPLGLTTDSATFFPTGSALAATWNTEMALLYGISIGEEAKTRGKEVLLGPAINICRTPLNGRTYEYMSEDPLLTGKLAAQYIAGVQKNNVAACVKHFAANNQETNRGQVSIEIDERTLREIYLPAFRESIVEGNAKAIMTAYNRVNGIYCAENKHLVTDILRNEWGFDGIVVSDWGGTHSTVNTALYGLDVEMGSYRNGPYLAEPLLDSVRAGIVPESVIDKKVKQILKVMNFVRNSPKLPSDTVTSTPEHMDAAYEIASQSIVLLKNSADLLPLDLTKFKNIAVIGENAKSHNATGGYGAGVKARYEITPWQGLKNRIGDKVKLKFFQGYKSEFYKTETTGFGILPEEKPDEDLINEAVEAARQSDLAIIFAGTNHLVETETSDRVSLKLPFGQDELIKAVCSVNKNVIIIIVAGAPTDLSTAKENSSALLYSWWNGSEGGNAIADVLTGKINPSGKLPFTFPEKIEDSPAHYLNAFPGKDSVVYKEGLLVGYRWFETKKITPQYCFGYGLSYTDFEISELKTDSHNYTEEDVIKLSVKVKNTGSRDGYEVVQIYVSAPKSEITKPEKELRAFKKVFVPAGKNVEVKLEIPVSKLAYYEINKPGWIVEKGIYKLIAAKSSEEMILEKSVEID